MGARPKRRRGSRRCGPHVVLRVDPGLLRSGRHCGQQRRASRQAAQAMIHREPPKRCLPGSADHGCPVVRKHERASMEQAACLAKECLQQCLEMSVATVFFKLSRHSRLALPPDHSLKHIVPVMSSSVVQMHISTCQWPPKASNKLCNSTGGHHTARSWTPKLRKPAVP